MIEFYRLTTDDLSFLNEVRNECAVEYLHDSRIFTLEETIKWFNEVKPVFWIIRLNGEKIGYFRTSNYSLVDESIYVGADLHKDFRGKGLAYESYCKFLPFLFNEFALNKIMLEVLNTNKRAISLYNKLGFKIDEIKIDEILKNGVFVNSIVMSIDKKRLCVLNNTK